MYMGGVTRACWPRRSESGVSVLDPRLRHPDGVIIGVASSAERHTKQCQHVVCVEPSAFADAHRRSGTPAIAVRFVGSRLDLPPLMLSHAHVAHSSALAFFKREASARSGHPVASPAGAQAVRTSPLSFYPDSAHSGQRHDGCGMLTVGCFLQMLGLMGGAAPRYTYGYIASRAERVGRAPGNRT